MLARPLRQSLPLLEVAAAVAAVGAEAVVAVVAAVDRPSASVGAAPWSYRVALQDQ